MAKAKRVVYGVRDQAVILCSLSCAQDYTDQGNGDARKVHTMAWHPERQSLAAMYAMETATCSQCGMEINGAMEMDAAS